MSFSCGGTEVKPPKCGFIIRQPKNRRSAVVYVSTGLACLPRDIDAFATTAEVRLYMSTPRDESPVCKLFYSSFYTTAIRRLPSPSDCYRPTSVCINGTVHRHPKNRRRAVIYVSTGLACLPRDIDAFATTAEVRLYKHTEANALQTGSPPKTKFPTAKPQPETV